MPHISNNCLQRVKCSNVFQLSKKTCACICISLCLVFFSYTIQFSYRCSDFINILKRWLFWSRQEAVFHHHSKSHFPVFPIFLSGFISTIHRIHFISFSSSVYLFDCCLLRTTPDPKSVYGNAQMIIVDDFSFGCSLSTRSLGRWWTALNNIHLVWLSFSFRFGRCMPMLARVWAIILCGFISGFYLFFLYEKWFQFIYIILWTNIH